MKTKNLVIKKGNPLSLRGRTFTGTVTKMGSQKTVTIEWSRLFYIHKYERYEKRSSKVKAHKPDEIKVEIGDTVKIIETRPISKTKNFVVLEVMK
jgi:small subunit ribosomal protein S17|tara:strand:- start:15768 stop:16052 length:285 start_codon:yes stop_codon:yes gene_type:complete